MGFLYAVIAFLVGQFTFSQLLGALFVAFPTLNEYKGKFLRLENHFKIVVGIQLIIVTVVLVITFVVLKKYWVFILIGYFVVPTFIFFFSRKAFKEEVYEMMDNECPKREEMFKETKDFILNRLENEFDCEDQNLEYISKKIGDFEEKASEEVKTSDDNLGKEIESPIECDNDTKILRFYRCHECGYQVFEDDEKCYNCGAKNLLKEHIEKQKNEKK